MQEFIRATFAPVQYLWREGPELRRGRGMSASITVRCPIVGCGGEVECLPLFLGRGTGEEFEPLPVFSSANYLSGGSLPPPDGACPNCGVMVRVTFQVAMQVLSFAQRRGTSLSRVLTAAET